MRLPFLFAALLVARFAAAQTEEIPEPITYTSEARTMLDGFHPGDTTWVFGDKINVRTSPAKDAPVAAQLVGGEQVIVLDTAQFMLMNGLDQRWLKVGFRKNGAAQEGYVWGGLLALGSVQLGDMRMVYGAASAKFEEGLEGLPAFQIEVRAFPANGQLRSSATYKLDMPGSYISQIGRVPSLGLAQFPVGGVKIWFSGEACGYPSYDLYVFWDGAKLVPLPSLQSVADGGMLYHGEEYIFPYLQPEYSRQPDAIFLKESHFEVIHEDEIQSDEWAKVRRMLWDGKKFTKPSMK